MPSNYKANDPYVNEQVDLDDIFISDAWLIDQFVGGNLFVWGGAGPGGNYGALGNGSTAQYSSPIQIGSLTNWKQVTGGYVSAGIKTDGTLWAWGLGINGTLGNGFATSGNAYSSPIQIGSLTNWKQISVSGGNGTAAAIKTDGSLWAWGYNNYGEMGNGTRSIYSSPIQIGSLYNYKQVSCGYTNIIISTVKTDGTLWICGYGASGQLGNGASGSTAKYSSPIQIGSLTNWKQVSCGYAPAAIKTDGTLWAWGYNAYGELGNSTTINYSSPVQIGSMTNWKQISSASFHKIAIKTDGTLWTWGYNGYGQLGNGTTINYSSPIQVGSLTNWKQISEGLTNNTIATKTDGTLWAWGYGGNGQLGNGTTVSYSSPIQVGLLTNWKQVGFCNRESVTFGVTFKDLG